MTTRRASAFIEENGGVLLHQPEPGADRRGPWDLPTVEVVPPETDRVALERHLQTLFEIPFSIDEVMADLALTTGEERVVFRVTLDMSNGPPRKPVPGVLGFFGRARLDESAMQPELIAALAKRKPSKAKPKPRSR